MSRASLKEVELLRRTSWAPLKFIKNISSKKSSFTKNSLIKKYSRKNIRKFFEKHTFFEIEFTEIFEKNAHCRSLQCYESCSRVCANKLFANTSKKVRFRHAIKTEYQANHRLLYVLFYALFGFLCFRKSVYTDIWAKSLIPQIQNSAVILKIVHHRRKSSFSNIVYQSITLTTRTVADGHAKYS